jgi:hypothetical protein
VPQAIVEAASRRNSLKAEQQQLQQQQQQLKLELLPDVEAADALPSGCCGGMLLLLRPAALVRLDCGDRGALEGAVHDATQPPHLQLQLQFQGSRTFRPEPG